MSDERRDYAVLISLMMREEAEVVAAALRADGVDAFVGNSYHAHMSWLHTFAMGGLQVLVPRRRVEEAKALLRERIREHATAEPEARVERRDRWKMSVLVIGFYGAGLLYMLMIAWLWSPYEQIPITEWISTITSMPTFW